MVKFINSITGTQMWVADDRVEEYKAAGHRLAATPIKATEPIKEPVEEKTVKPTVKEVVKKAVKKPVKATKK